MRWVILVLIVSGILFIKPKRMEYLCHEDGICDDIGNLIPERYIRMNVFSYFEQDCRLSTNNGKNCQLIGFRFSLSMPEEHIILMFLMEDKNLQESFWMALRRHAPRLKKFKLSGTIILGSAHIHRRLQINYRIVDEHNIHLFHIFKGVIQYLRWRKIQVSTEISVAL